MRRILALFLLLITALSLAGCGKTAELPAAGMPDTPGEHQPADPPAETLASFTDEGYRVRMEVTLPDDWDFQLADVQETDPPLSEGIYFYPKDDPEVKISLLCYPDGFGMCGTGVDFSELTLREDLTAQQGVERLSDTPCKDSDMKPVNYGYFTVIFRDVPGSYVAQFELTAEQETAYYDTILSILATAQLGPEDAMRESKAIELAQAEYEKLPDLPKADDVFGRYNREDNSWTVHYYCAEQGLSFAFYVDAYGKVYPCRDSEPLKSAPLMVEEVKIAP